MVRFCILAALCGVIAIIACSSKDNPIAPKPPDNPVVLDTGGLAQIPGDPTDTAVSVLPDIPCHPAPQDKMNDDGFMRTRLSAKLHPEATLEALNAALASEQAVVTFANPGELDLSLRIPEVATSEEAEAVASRLMATGAFLAVFPGFAVGLDGQAEIFSAPGTEYTTWEYLTRIKMPAAWNAKGLAERLGQKVTVLVPDKYASSNRHSDIPAQKFLTTSGTYENIPLSDGKIPGNHGFHVCGILAASLDGDQGTGAHPGNTTLLDLQSLSIGGQLFHEVIDNLRDHLPTTGQFVLNTSLGYNWSISTFSKLQRAYDAIRWRAVAAPHQDRFLHCTSAGNRGRETDDTRFSHWNSPFTMAARFTTTQDMAPISEHTIAEFENLSIYAQQVYANTPSAQTPLTNVIIVGNSDYAGAKAPESCEPSDVRVLGDDIYNVCAVAEISGGDAGCQIENGVLRAKYSGTSMATPQVSGLAAYIWNLKPDLMVSEIMSIVINNFDETDPMIPGRVDAYQCVTSLDHSLADSPIRRELFDVAGTTPVAGSNQSFDEYDLQVYFDQFRAIQEARENQTGSTFDNSRYDLNGNGITTIDSLWINYETQRFDLDVNSPPYYALEVTQTIEGQSIAYDETELSDLDILCYYAYSPLYSGDTGRRTELCLPCLGELVVHMALTNELQQSVPADVEFTVWRKTSAADSLPVRLADLDVTVEGAEPFVFTGVTDEQGKYVEQIIPSTSSDNVIIRVDAKLNDVIVATDEVTVPVAGGVATITFLSRQSAGTAGAGKLLGTEPTCPPPTAGETSVTAEEGPFVIGLSKEYVCPGTTEGSVSASASASGSSDPGFTSGDSYANISYESNLSATAEGRAGVIMTATASHYFTVQFEVTGGTLAFEVNATGSNSGTTEKLNTSLVREGTGGGNVFVFDFPQGTPPQGMSGTIEPGVYRFTANQVAKATMDGSASETANASVLLEIRPVGVALGNSLSGTDRKLTTSR